MIERIYDNLSKYLEDGKVLVIFGPRQVGKTTLVLQYLDKIKATNSYLLGDNIKVQEVLGSLDQSRIIDFASKFTLLVIDEAQKIPHIGTALKIIVDLRKDIQIVATGSSSFDLAGQVGEPLTGRKRTLLLFPVSQQELRSDHSMYDLHNELQNYLVYGSYPSVLAAPNSHKKTTLLEEMIGSYLLKDILELEKVKGSKILLDLLRLIAYQIGSEVSTAELATQLSIDHKTVARYLDLFEKAFILFNLRGYSRNLRKEVSKMSKYYFYDNGIRNAVISNFNEIEIRNDVGQLWENFLVSERLKKQEYHEIHSNNFFWRTWDQQEVDWVEEREGKLFGYEFKWKTDKKMKMPKEWQQTYPEASYQIVDRDNYLDFVT